MEEQKDNKRLRALVSDIERSKDFGSDDKEVELKTLLEKYNMGWKWEGDRIRLFTRLSL